MPTNFMMHHISLKVQQFDSLLDDVLTSDEGNINMRKGPFCKDRQELLLSVADHINLII